MAEKPTYEELEQKVRELEVEVEKSKKVERTLYQQAQLLASIKDTIVIITPEMKTIYANQTAKDLFGDRPEMFTEPCYRFFKNRDTVCENCPVLKTIQDERPHQAIMKSYDKNGQEMWRFNTAFPFYDQDGQIIAGIEMVTDYTAQKRTEMALEESEQRFRLAAGIAADLIYEWDIVNDTLLWFGDIDKVLGYDPGELPRTVEAWVRLIHPDDQEMLREAVTHHRESTDPIMYEYRMQRKDGTWLYWTDRGTPALDDNGRPRKWIGVCIDRTERRHAEEALRESEKRYRALFDNMSDAVAIYEAKNKGEDFIFVDFNKAGESIENIPKEVLIGKSVSKMFPGVRDFGLFDVFKRVWKTGKPEHHPISMYKDERIAGWRDNFVYRLPNGQVVAVYSDETERKQAEAALRKSEEKYRNIFNNAQVGIFRTRISDGKILECNDRFSRTYGYKTPEACKDDFVVSEHYTDPGIREKLVASLMEKGAVNDFEACYSRKDGDNVWVRFSARTYPEEGYLEGVGYDITEEKRALGELRESEEKYRSVLENIEDGYYETDLAGNFTFFNNSLGRIFGFSEDELMGMNFKKNTDQESAGRLYKVFNKVYRTGTPVKGLRYMILRKEGSKVYVELSASLVKDSEGRKIGFRGITRDVTERKLAEEERIKLEAQLQQAQKMEAIVTLAGGVAHEFNNALMGIIGNIELLKMDLPEDEGRDKYFEAMKGSGHRMSHLVDQLLAYAQGGKYQPKNLKLDDFLIETVPILQHDLKPMVRVETHFPKDVSYIKADHTQMQMVLSAILANSDEAIEDEGLIKITAGNKDVDEEFEQHPGLKPGPYVCLTIEDDGKGIDEETRSRIFEPFFTTKFQGRGMGMAAVYGIVKNHDGWIYVDSELGKGTVVRIYLPVISAGIKERRPKRFKEPERKLAMGEGTILVIEDEEVLLEMNREILERLGYRVLQAKTGREGVEIAKTFDGQIDLALLDIKLPDMSGTQVYPLIMEARPDLKVVVCSGYSIDGPARQILDAGAEGFIQKPFLIAALAEKLKKVLDTG